MQRISSTKLQKLREGARLLQGTYSGPKVLLRNEKLIIKFIYKREKLFSSSKFYPYAERFQNNSQNLLKLGIKSPKVFKIFKFDGPMPSPCDIIFYAYVEGMSLDKIVTQLGDYSVLEKLTTYIAALHNKGVFFWDLHLGNVLQGIDGNFYLLDIASVKFCKKPLSIHKRARNVSRLIEVEQKQRGDATIATFGVRKFINLYLEALDSDTITQSQKNKLLLLINKRLGV